MAGSRAVVDADALRAAEQAFASTYEVVVCALTVRKIKAQAESTGSQLLKALGAKTFLAKEAPQPRLLVFTVRRGKQTRGFKPSFHTCKLPEPGAQHSSDLTASKLGTKSYGLKAITEIVVPASKYGDSGGSGPVLELRFTGSGASSYTRAEVVNQFKLRSSEELQLVLSVVVQLLRQNGYKLPKVSGIDLGDVHTWWLAQQAALLPQLGNFAAQVLASAGGDGHDGGAGGGETGGGGGGGGRVLLSAREEKDLEELLDMFAMGIGDVAEFEARLGQEHEALEAANVHTIMTSVPMADGVVTQIKKTLALLDDVDENLMVFDTKLRHMREDIAAIETSNNTLELQSRNNTKLLNTLQTLLEGLVLPPEMAAVLEDPPFAKDRLTSIARAGWVLFGMLQRLDPAEPNCLSYHLLEMRVVQDARESLSALSSRFVAKALQHLKVACNAAVDQVLAELSAVADRTAKLKPPSHDRLRSMCLKHAEVVRVLAALDPGCMPRLHAAYGTAVNMLIRKELRITVAELRKAASLDMQANPVDYGLTSKAHTDGHGGHVVGGGSQRGPGGSVMGGGTSMLGSSEGDDVGSLASHDAGGGGGGGGHAGSYGGGPGSVISKQSRSTFRSIISRGKGTYDPFNVAIPLQEAYQALLESYLPHLLAEVEGAAVFLLLYKEDMAAVRKAPSAEFLATATTKRSKSKGRRRRRGAADDVAWGDEEPDAEGGAAAAAAAVAATESPASRPLSWQGREVVEALLGAIDAEFMVLVDMTQKSHQVLCLAMAALTSQCVVALARRPSAFALTRALAAAHARLRGHFARYVEAQHAAVEAYGARMAALGSVKGVHVVNFITQFALMAHDMEVTLTFNAEPLVATLTMGLGPDGSTHSSPQRGGGGGAEDELDKHHEAIQEAIQEAASWQARPEADAVYASLVNLLFSTLEHVASSDPKHGERLRGENYCYFVEGVRPLVRHVVALEPYMLQAEAKQEESIQRYVTAQLQYTSLWKVLELSEKVDKLLEVVSPGEVAYQAGCSQAEVRALISGSMKEADKKIQKTYGRIKKHLGNSNLAFRVWERVYEQMMLRYGRLGEQLAACYPDLSLNPSLEVLEELLAGVGPGQGDGGR